MATKKWQSFFILSAVLLSGCASYTFEKQNDGVVIKLAKHKVTDVNTVKIQVCSDNIIRVIASPGDAFSARKSLIVEKKHWETAPFTVQGNGDIIRISTAKITAKVSAKTGEIAFYNKKGWLILQEKKGGGKSIMPAEVMGEQTFNIRQVFKSPADEAFYGLGAHQNNIMNYKGHNVDLLQYNIVDVIPFLVSSRATADSPRAETTESSGTTIHARNSATSETISQYHH